jgi:hypothetical protein
MVSGVLFCFSYFFSSGSSLRVSLKKSAHETPGGTPTRQVSYGIPNQIPGSSPSSPPRPGRSASGLAVLQEARPRRSPYSRKCALLSFTPSRRSRVLPSVADDRRKVRGGGVLQYCKDVCDAGHPGFHRPSWFNLHNQLDIGPPSPRFDARWTAFRGMLGERGDLAGELAGHCAQFCAHPRSKSVSIGSQGERERIGEPLHKHTGDL